MRVHTSSNFAADQDETKDIPNHESTAVYFTLNLEKGETQLHTWFMDEKDKELCGAYYVYVKRI
jgi:hypothetical protein